MNKARYTTEKMIPKSDRITVRVDEAMELFQLSRASIMREAEKRGALIRFGKSPRIILSKMKEGLEV